MLLALSRRVVINTIIIISIRLTLSTQETFIQDADAWRNVSKILNAYLQIFYNCVTRLEGVRFAIFILFLFLISSLNR